jgi:ADP-ribosyl-[dinitrogen reductase] hydrolase
MTHLINESPYIKHSKVEEICRAIIREKLDAALLDRYEGALLGVLVGDTQGLQYENMTADQIRERRQGRPLVLEPFRRMNQAYTADVDCPAGLGSDDSTQTILLAESLIVDGFDPQQQFEAYREGFFSKKGIPFGENIGWGPSTIKKLEEPFLSTTLSAHSEGLITDGSLMRTAPITLWKRGTPSEIVRLAGIASAVTHNSPIAMELCSAYCLMLEDALAGKNQKEVLASIRARSNLFGRDTQEVLHTDFSTYQAPQSGKAMYHASTAFSVAIQAWLTSTTFEQAIDHAISVGGDTDTNAAIAGALSGATYGKAAIPKRWLVLNCKERFERAALALLLRNNEVA